MKTLMMIVLLNFSYLATDLAILLLLYAFTRVWIANGQRKSYERYLQRLVEGH